MPSLGPHDVLVHINFTGICGSDVHYWKHGCIGQYVVQEPMVLGHESSGVVAAVGDEVRSVAFGDRVALEPGRPCRQCVRCREGRYNLCFGMKFAATPPVNGTLTKYYALPEDFCYKLPDHISLEAGALVEPLGVSVHIVRQAEIKPSSNVVVFGAGAIGLLCCAVARAFGAEKIICIDLNPDRLTFAQSYAATHVALSRHEPPEDMAARLIEDCQLGPGADCVIDATGAEPCVQTAIHVLRAGGIYVQAGMGRPKITFPIGVLCSKELVAKGSFRYGPGDYQLAINLLANRRISVDQLITGKVKFEESERAFEEVSAAQGIKTLIEGVDL